MFFTWDIIQISGLFILALLIITQVVISPFIGLPYFWLFRKSGKELLKTNDELSTSRIDQETEELKKQITKIRKKI